MILNFTSSPSEQDWVAAVKECIDNKELGVKSLGTERVDKPKILLSEHDHSDEGPQQIHMRKGHRVTTTDGAVITKTEIHAIARKRLKGSSVPRFVMTDWVGGCVSL